MVEMNMVRSTTAKPASTILFCYAFSAGVRGSVVVEALCYKPEGRGFDF
jgi:hypothetical protein